jgi:predicted transcriptional regulator
LKIELTEKQKDVLKILENFPDGIWFNELARICNKKNIVSHDTLVDYLGYYVEIGLVEKEPNNPRKGQKIFYKLTESHKKFDMNLKKMDELINNTLIWISVLDYFLDKKLLENNSLIDDFFKGLFQQYTVIFLDAINFSQDFPEEFRELFYQNAFNKIIELMHILSLVLKKYPLKYLPSFSLDQPKIFKLLETNHEDYVKWLVESKNDSYSNIKKIVEKQTSQYSS